MNYGGKTISKRCDFRRFLKGVIEGTDRMSSGRAFQIAGASKARLKWLKNYRLEVGRLLGYFRH